MSITEKKKKKLELYNIEKLSIANMILLNLILEVYIE